MKTNELYDLCPRCMYYKCTVDVHQFTLYIEENEKLRHLQLYDWVLSPEVAQFQCSMIL